VGGEVGILSLWCECSLFATLSPLASIHFGLLTHVNLLNPSETAWPDTYRDRTDVQRVLKHGKDSRFDEIKKNTGQFSVAWYVLFPSPPGPLSPPRHINHRPLFFAPSSIRVAQANIQARSSNMDHPSFPPRHLGQYDPKSSTPSTRSKGFDRSRNLGRGIRIGDHG
jgi:hypothetical protein